LNEKIEALNVFYNIAIGLSSVAEKPRSQMLAYKQLIWRQTQKILIRTILHAGAAYGKSHLLCCFLDHENLQNRTWAVLAPSAVAAKTVNGKTIHLFFGLGIDYNSKLHPDSE